jgi:glycosyltransferase involved in cell wall biosynthesis
MADLRRAEKTFSLRPGRYSWLPNMVSLPSVSSSPSRQGNNDELTMIFFASFSYHPNQRALDNLLHKIVPLLNLRHSLRFTLLVCGSGLSSTYVNSNFHGIGNISYLGFVPELASVLSTADICIVPMTEGGGTQTKIILALAAGITVISSKTGAQGIDQPACGQKLICVDDEDWPEYAAAVVKAKDTVSIPTPQDFFDTYKWESISDRTISSLNNL